MRGHILPRLIRLRDVAHYLGMDPNRFNAEVRLYITEIPIDKQCLAFDRLDLYAWVDEYKRSNGRPGKQKGAGKQWDAENPRSYQHARDMAHRQGYQRKKSLRERRHERLRHSEASGEE